MPGRWEAGRFQRVPKGEGKMSRRGRRCTKVEAVSRGLSSRHDAILDLKLSKPWLTQNEIAFELGFTPAWVSTVVNSTAFRATYAERYQEVFDKVVVPMRDKLAGTASLAMERVNETLSEPECDPGYALDAMDKTLKAMGFGKGPRNVSGTNVQVNNYGVDPDTLKAARERIANRNGQAEPGPAPEPAPDVVVEIS